MSISEYFDDWCNVVDIAEADRIAKYLSKSKEPLCPKLKNVFSTFKYCDYNNLRVLIIGQDPYCNYVNNSPVATGIAFANPKDTLEENFSPSLKVLMESIIDFSIPHGIINFDPSLEKWEEQGVLMLNSALSCIKNKTGSHSLLWRPFIISLLKRLSFDKIGLVYVLMGNAAQSFKDYINSKFNHIITIPHPSYYARTHQKMPHSLWHDINKILIGQNGYGIEWYKEENYSEQEDQECHSIAV